MKKTKKTTYFIIFFLLVPQYSYKHSLSLRQQIKTTTIMTTRILVFCIFVGLFTYSVIGLPTIVFQLIGAGVAVYYLEFKNKDEKAEIKSE